MKLSHLVVALALLVHSCLLESLADEGTVILDDEDASHATEDPGPEKRNDDSTLPEASPLVSEDSQQGYRMPGLFGFNGGEPFYLEKDPVTGAVDFNTKTESMKRKEENVDTDEYFYEDEEETGDGIDRRDGGFVEAGIGNPNHFSPYANDVNARIVNHKYDANHKFPLISSSYANTKIQGTGAESHKYNHKPHVTSSTQSPSYYTIRPPRPTYVNPPRTSTTTIQPLFDNDNEHTRSTEKETSTFKAPASNGGYTTQPEKSSAVQGNLQRDNSTNKGTEYSKQTTPPSKQTDADDYYEDEYDADSGSEFKLSDFFGYGQTSDNDKLEHQDNVHHSSKYDQIPAASYETSSQFRPVVENDKTENVSENIYIITTEKTLPPNQSYNSQTSHQWIQQNQHSNVHILESHNHSFAMNETKSNNNSTFINQPQEQFIRPPAETEVLAETYQKAKPVVVVVPSSTPLTTPFVGIIYSESEKSKVATSMPLGTHFQYTTQRPLLGFETQTRPTVQNQGAQHFQQSASHFPKNDSGNNSSFKLSAQPGAPQDVSKPVNITPSAPFSSSATISPYGSYAEEPFRPIFGPGNLVIKEAEIPHPQHQPLIAPPPVKNSNTVTVVGQESLVVPVRQQVPSKIPEETPTRWNYPYREGSSQYFQLPKQHQQPPKFPGVQPPNPNIKPATFTQDEAGKLATSSASIVDATKNQDDTTQKPLLPHQNLGWFNDYEKKVNTGLGFASGDNAVETSKITLESGIQFSSENDFENDKTKQPQQSQAGLGSEELVNFRVPPLPDQRRPPSLARPSSLPPSPNTVPYILQEPAQDLRPPADPEISRVGSQNFPRPHWESRPSGPQKLIPQTMPHTARPKQDTVPTYFGQIPGHIGHRPRPGVTSPSMLQGNRMHLKSNPNQDSRLPNILPQFRPNAKISYGHSDGDGRVPADPYFGQPPRQTFLERPARRPQAEIPEHLQPPPPSNFRRVNRNEGPAAPVEGPDAEDIFHFEKDPPPPPPAVVQQKPLVHRRTGPHFSNNGNAHTPVATLQMMQQHQQLLVSNKHHLGRPLAARDDFPDKYDSDDSLKPPYHVTYPVGSNLDAEASEKRPVFVVYPVNSDSATTDNSAIVMGTRGPNWPVPPSNLAASDDIVPETYPLEENPLALPFIGHKDQKPLLQLPSDRLDAPVLKTQNHASAVKPIKTDFPYVLVPPTPIENDKYTIDNKYSMNSNVTSVVSKSNGTLKLGEENDHKETFSIFDDIPAEVHNSNIDRREDNDDDDDDDDSEINIIPYLQDYMPFATKKPITNPKPVFSTTPASPNSIAVDFDNHPQKPWSSPTYEPPYRSSSPISVTLKTVQPTKAATTEHSKSPSSWLSTKGEEEKVSGSEFTVSAVMHTHQSNHRPAIEESTTSPPQLNFQAPFLASENIASVSTNKGWSVVSSASPGREESKQSAAKNNVPDEQPEASKIKNESENSDPSNFDFENFRPQLFGGFKPIYSFPTKDTDERSRFTTEREEKMI